MRPGDEPPGPAPDRRLVEARRRRRRHDGRHRHRQELGKDVERLGQGEARSWCRRAPRCPSTVRALPAAYSRAPWIGKSGHWRARLRGRGRAPGAIEARTSRGADRPAVVERGAGPEVEGVDRAASSRVSQRVARPGLEPAVGVELDQVVEQQRDDLAALHVGGQRGVERRGVGAQVVGEPRAATARRRRRRRRAARAGRQEAQRSDESGGRSAGRPHVDMRRKVVKLPGLEHAVNRAADPSPSLVARPRCLSEGPGRGGAGIAPRGRRSGAGAGAQPGRPPAGLRGQPGALATRSSRSAIATTNSSWFARALPVPLAGPGREALLRRAGVQARRRPAGGALPAERLSRTCRSTRSSGATPDGRLHHLPDQGGRADPGDPARHPGLDSLPGAVRRRRRWSISRCSAAIRSTATSCRRPRTPSPAGCGTAAIRRRGSSPASRPTGRRRRPPVTLRDRAPGRRAVIGEVKRGRHQPDRRRRSSATC